MELEYRKLSAIFLWCSLRSVSAALAPRPSTRLVSRPCRPLTPHRFNNIDTMLAQTEELGTPVDVCLFRISFGCQIYPITKTNVYHQPRSKSFNRQDGSIINSSRVITTWKSTVAFNCEIFTPHDSLLNESESQSRQYSRLCSLNENNEKLFLVSRQGISVAHNSSRVIIWPFSPTLENVLLHMSSVRACFPFPFVCNYSRSRETAALFTL